MKKNHDRAPDKKGFSIALPKVLIEEIEAVAKGESRSRNGQIEHLLKQGIAAWRISKREDTPGQSGSFALGNGTTGH